LEPSERLDGVPRVTPVDSGPDRRCHGPVDIRRNQLLGFAGWLGLVLSAGCSTPSSPEDLRHEDFRGLAAAQVSQPKPGGPAATIEGRPVADEELKPLLEEAAGALVLREIALDRAVAEACEARGISIKDTDIDAERAKLLDVIERDAKAEPTDAGVLMEKLRRSRGLGEARFSRLLRRNAGLRKLIESRVEVSAAEVEQALRIQYGQKFRVRVIVAVSEREAARLKQELEREPVPLDVAFARRAFIESVDSSSSRGGLLAPISPADQAYPDSIRSLLPTLEPGKLSPVIAVDQGFAILLLDSRVDGVAPPEGAEKEAERQIRLRKQRVAMEDAARRFLAGQKIVPLTPGLTWSWEAAADPR
jgi:hypothetical protein